MLLPEPAPVLGENPQCAAHSLAQWRSEVVGKLWGRAGAPLSHAQLERRLASCYKQRGWL